MRASWNKGSAYSWQKLMWNDAKVRWLLALTMYTKPFSHRREWGKKSPLWSFIIDWAFYQGSKNENEHWLTGAVARKRERDWDGPHHMLIATSSMGRRRWNILNLGEKRESRTHDFPCFPWLVRILPAGLCKGDREIRLANLGGGGGHVGVDRAPIKSLGQTGKNDKHRLSLFANWIIQHFVSGVRIRAFLTHVHHGHDITPSGVTVSVEKMESVNWKNG